MDGHVWDFVNLDLFTQQVSFEEKEADTCQLFEERQKYCAEEMEGLKQRCSTKLRQVSQMVSKAHQALQQQVSQLQVSQTPLLWLFIPMSLHLATTSVNVSINRTRLCV